MTKSEIKAAVAKAEATLKAVKMTIEAAEVFWEENGAIDHPIFNNDLYDMLHHAEEAVKQAKIGGAVEFCHTRNLAAANMD